MTRWTLEELAERSQRYLTDEGDSRRVQWKPNGRQIRYYSTLGLVDKPDTENGRLVWYGPRHLVQLLAIKRLQLDGLKLAEIQRSLTGASVEELRRLAGLPDEILEGHRDSVSSVQRRGDRPFWETRPSSRAAPNFQALWRLEIADGIALTLEPTIFDSMTEHEREELSHALIETWKKHQPKNTKEKP